MYRLKRLVLIVFILFALMVLFNHNLFRPLSSKTSDQLTNEESGHKLAIIVPFRDRFDELLLFVPHISQFIRSQAINSFKIYIINQSTRYRFNRGALANVGYLLAKNETDYIAVHDVDLLPLNTNLSYSYPHSGPYHLSSPEYHPQYNYSKYFGGIMLIRNDLFQLVNGFSNRYFGWGLEDDEFYTRIKEAGLNITRPGNLTTDRSNTFIHVHYDRKRDTFKTKEQREVSRKRDRVTGLKNLKYMVESKHELTIDGHNCTIYNVELYCDIKQTPWCLKIKTQTQKRTTNLLLTT